MFVYSVCRGRLIGINSVGRLRIYVCRRCFASAPGGGLCYACFGARRERGSYGLPPSSPIASHSLATVGGECEFPQCVRLLALITRGWSKPLQLSPSHVTYCWQRCISCIEDLSILFFIDSRKRKFCPPGPAVHGSDTVQGVPENSANASVRKKSGGKQTVGHCCVSPSYREPR